MLQCGGVGTAMQWYWCHGAVVSVLVAQCGGIGSTEGLKWSYKKGLKRLENIFVVKVYNIIILHDNILFY